MKYKDLNIENAELNAWKALSVKSNWRITKIPNGFYQGEYSEDKANWKAIVRDKTVERVERRIDHIVSEAQVKIKEMTDTPVVVKTFPLAKK